MAILDRIVTRVLGCWHKNMGAPVTRNGQTYRVCTTCGAQRVFNTEKWRMTGSYFFAPASTVTLAPSKISTLRQVDKPLTV